jgi:hypothetical protein
VGIDDLGDDRQAQASPTGPSIARRVQPDEPVEYPVAVGRRYTWPVVRYDDQGVVVEHPTLETNAVVRMSDRIVDEVPDES